MLGTRFQEALVYAAQLHAQQERKGTGVPYLSHLLGVASLALENGADEDLAIAALLHDAVEDQPRGGQTQADIGQRFGPRVLKVVLGCSDSTTDDKAPWRTRKEQYLAHLREVDADVWLVSASDKLHNARAILGDYRQHGEALWARFSGKREGVLWYYRALHEVFRDVKAPAGLVSELGRVVEALEGLSRAA